MSTTTRTLNPLHFEDLEPHRFEDLVRQLAYTFRPWHVLEATGRLGADDGIDIRGIERAPAESGIASSDNGDEEEEDLPLAVREEREWRIQCKRERRIGPTAIGRIGDALLTDPEHPPYGVIVAAACDFSKKTRDRFRVQMAEAGVEEFYLWGKAELEDALFRPSHDHLLWAYFGISLRVRRTSATAKFRSRLATKRKLIKTIGEIGRYPQAHLVLIRDASAEEYPWPRDAAEFLVEPRWRYYPCEGHVAPEYLGFVARQFYAWWDEASGRFDVIGDVDCSWPRHPELVGVERPDAAHDETVRRYWTTKVPESKQATLIETGFIHYDQILVVDEFGDPYHEGPHLVVDYEGRARPFRSSRAVVKASGDSGQREADLEGLRHHEFFPDSIPSVSHEEWTAYWDARKT